MPARTSGVLSAQGDRLAAMTTDQRFRTPLYSVAEAARYLDVPVSTFRAWVHGYQRSPEGRRPVCGESIVTTLPRDAGVSIPFIGLAEAHALTAIRGAGVPLQRIRPALDRLSEELGIQHVLASRSLYTDGSTMCPAQGPNADMFAFTASTSADQSRKSATCG